MTAVSAATFMPPTEQPPEGNMPETIWNAEGFIAPTTTQTGASINIAGDLAVGGSDLDLTLGEAGQNLYYGVADYDTMHQGDYLLLLQAFQDPDFNHRLSLNKDGDLKVSGCFGPVFRGITSTSFTGSLNEAADRGYFWAKDKCATEFTGTHICTVREILESLKCAREFPTFPNDRIMDPSFDGQDAWILGGPPGFTAPANDCQGWFSQGTDNLGRIWRFDSTSGGVGFLTTCNQAVPFACCR